MTIDKPTGIITDWDDLDARPDRFTADQAALARWAVHAHPVEREKALRSRLNDPANRHEYIDADLFGENVHALLWDGNGATRVVGGAAPIGVHLGNFTFPTATIAYKVGPLERWNSEWWARFAPLFATTPDRLLEVVRRRLKSHPGEWTRRTTLKAKDGDYGAADWVHESDDPRLAIWEMDHAHPAQRIV